MPTVNPTLPADDTGADVADYNTPILAILAVFNGHIDADNIEPGSLPWSVMDSFTNEIPAAAMEDEGNAVKFRDEANLYFVASGLTWSALTGLNAAMSSGVLYTADGARTAVSAVATRAFTVSKDTYVDISPAGSVNYTEVANGAASPALTADYVRVAKVVTNGSAVTSVTTSGLDSLNNYIRPTGMIGPSMRRGGYKVGTFTITATGAKAITGVGFKPKFLRIVFLRTASASAGSNSEGVTDGVTQVARNIAASDTPNAGGTYSTSKVILVTNTSNTILIDATLTSFDSDGFTLNVATYTATYGNNFFYVAQG